MSGVHVQLRRVGKRFGARNVLHGIDLDIAPGEFTAIVGRSGCGKSTLLRLVAGLEAASDGVVSVDGEHVRSAGATTRVMFQDARLLPWRRVLANVTLGHRDEPRAREVLAQVGLADRAQDWPARLSGGQRQRVALARALVHRPRLLLLDEPLGALDALTRIEMQQLIASLWRREGFTALLVTHDVQEAVALADRVLLVEDGRIAMDERITLARPRRAGDPDVARLEQRILDRVLQKPAADDAPPSTWPAMPAPAWQWAVIPFTQEKTMTIQAINVRNQFRGKVREILRGDVLSEVDVETPFGIVTSVITTRSVDELRLQPGSEVVALVKATEVSIAKL